MGGVRKNEIKHGLMMVTGEFIIIFSNGGIMG